MFSTLSKHADREAVAQAAARYKTRILNSITGCDSTFIVGGETVIVSSSDIDMVMQFRWFLRSAENSQNYLARTTDCVALHRFLLQPQKTDKTVVDHINGCGLDNRRCNLRIATAAENNRNRTWATELKKELLRGGSVQILHPKLQRHLNGYDKAIYNPWR